MVKKNSGIRIGEMILDPDIIMKSDGIACGDRLVISLCTIDNRTYFNFYAECCDVCAAVCKYLVDSFSGEPKEKLHVLFKDKTERQDILSLIPGNLLDSKRIQCVLTPLNLLKYTLYSTKNKEIEKQFDLPMACDACVKTLSVNWSASLEEQKRIKLSKIFRDVSKSVEKNNARLLRLSKCHLNDFEKDELMSVMGHLTVDEIKASKKLRLPVLFYNNMVRFNDGIVMNDVMALATKQIISNNIASIEIDQINTMIKNRNWKIATVKGAKTSSYYPSDSERTHLDFDYVASDYKDGFEFISYLLNDRGFKFISGGSVPFSMKVIMNKNSNEVMTGHLHLEKILQDRYQVIIDINLGGFPLGRTSIIEIDHTGEITTEEQIVITLCHIFKHEKVYMKDLNDLYYMLKSGDYDYSNLNRLIHENKLSFLFHLVLDVLDREFDYRPNDLTARECVGNKVVKRLFCYSWPYSVKEHFYAKVYDMLIRCVKTYGILPGLRESYNQLTNNSEQTVSVRSFSGLTSSMNKRVYLSPLIIFRRLLEIEHVDDMNKNIMEGLIYRINDLIVTTFGIFLLIDKSNNRFNRKEIHFDMMKVLERLNIDSEDILEDYIMQARMDLWLY